jgi:hypothetical protein
MKAIPHQDSTFRVLQYGACMRSVVLAGLLLVGFGDRARKLIQIAPKK